MVNANTAAACPARAACRSPRRPARVHAAGESAEEAGNARASGVGRTAAVDDAPPPRGAEPNVLAGIRADEHAASPSRMHRHPVAVVRMRYACGEAALRRAVRDAFAYRCGGSTGWLDCGAGRLPVSRLTARAGAARASTKTRASVGGGAHSVKAAAREPMRARIAAGFSVRTLDPFAATDPRSPRATLPLYRDRFRCIRTSGIPALRTDRLPRAQCTLCYRMRRVRCSRPPSGARS